MDDWRELETLVARLEAVSAPYPVQVTSPDYIEGSMSGVRREVDVSVRGAVGSMKLLVIFECRKRSTPQDVRWIEEIATKREDVGANAAVAVSSSGFSEAARRMANAKGIELRSSTEISEENVRSWIQISGVGVHRQIFRDYDINFTVLDSPLREPRISAPHGGDPMDIELQAITTGRRVTLREVWDLSVENSGLSSAGEEPTRVSFTVSRPEAPMFRVVTDGGVKTVGLLILSATRDLIESELPVTSIRRVEGPDGSVLGEEVVAEGMVGRQRYVARFLRTEEGIFPSVEISPNRGVVSARLTGEIGINEVEL